MAQLPQMLYDYTPNEMKVILGMSESLLRCWIINMISFIFFFSFFAHLPALTSLWVWTAPPYPSSCCTMMQAPLYVSMRRPSAYKK